MQQNASEAVPFVVFTHGDKGKFHVMKFVLSIHFQLHSV